jgi:ABC-type bacteriocin/lantibiotic exporter with double-glycine peptidase domain
MSPSLRTPIFIGSTNISSINVKYLRHIPAVSQNPNLFDATTTENMSGNEHVSEVDIYEGCQRRRVCESEGGAGDSDMG